MEEDIIRYYFNQKRKELGFSLKEISATSLIRADVISRYEKGIQKLESYQTDKLFHAIGLDFETMMVTYEKNMAAIEELYNKIAYVFPYAKEFSNLEKNEIKLEKGFEYYNYLIIKSLIRYESLEITTKIHSIINPVYQYLTKEFKQIYLNAQGLSLSHQSRYNEAVEYFKKAIYLGESPNIGSLSEFYILRVSLHRSDYLNAEEYFIKSKEHLQNEKNHHRFTNVMIFEGLFLVKRRQLEKAIETFRKCLEYARIHGLKIFENGILNNIAMSYMLSGDYKNTLKSSDALIINGDNRYDVYVYKAWSYYKINEFTAAKIIIDKGRKVFQNDNYFIKYLEMIAALIDSSEDLQERLLSCLDATIDKGEESMILFVLDIVIDYYKQSQDKDNIIKYQSLKIGYLES